MLETKLLSFSDKNRVLIKDVSLKFSSGFLYGIVGPNGSGKTTFLKSLCGIWQPTAGSVLWQGQNLLHQNRRTISQTISLVAPQNYLPFNFSVLDVVSMGLYPNGMSTKTNTVETILLAVDVWHLRNRPLMQLSHGERQRVFIARALATDAPIMALDEPTANLDIKHQLLIWELLCKLAAQGKIVIVATHDLIAAKKHCHEVAVIHDGKCVTSGKPADVLQDDLLHSVFQVDTSLLAKTSWY